MKKNINIVSDLDGSSIVLINDVRFKARRGIDWLVRCDKDRKLYLYDLVRTKKETSKPLEQ